MKGTWKWLYRTIWGIALLLLALRGLDWVARRSSRLPAAPTPNAYFGLISIANQVERPKSDTADLTTNQLRALSARNAPYLKDIRGLLTAPSGVPLQATPKWSAKHDEDLKSFKGLAAAMSLDSRMLMVDGFTNEAATRTLDILLLGQTVARGGIKIDGINGQVFELIGAGLLRGQLASIDAEHCRAFARELESAEARREKPEKMLENEKEWLNASHGLISRMGMLFLNKAIARSNTEFISRYAATIHRTRRILVQLAARAYELDKKKPADSPTALVPDYLREVPIDPATGKPFDSVGVVGEPSPK